MTVVVSSAESEDVDEALRRLPVDISREGSFEEEVFDLERLLDFFDFLSFLDFLETETGIDVEESSSSSEDNVVYSFSLGLIFCGLTGLNFHIFSTKVFTSPVNSASVFKVMRKADFVGEDTKRERM